MDFSCEKLPKMRKNGGGRRILLAILVELLCQKDVSYISKIGNFWDNFS